MEGKKVRIVYVNNNYHLVGLTGVVQKQPYNIFGDKTNVVGIKLDVMSKHGGEINLPLNYLEEI